MVQTLFIEMSKTFADYFLKRHPFMLPLLKLTFLKPVLLIIAALVIFSYACVTLKSDAVQMFLNCTLLLYNMYCLCACQMQIKATYLLIYLFFLSNIFFGV